MGKCHEERPKKVEKFMLGKREEKKLELAKKRVQEPTGIRVGGKSVTTRGEGTKAVW